MVLHLETKLIIRSGSMTPTMYNRFRRFSQVLASAIIHSIFLELQRSGNGVPRFISLKARAVVPQVTPL